MLVNADSGLKGGVRKMLFGFETQRGRAEANLLNGLMADLLVRLLRPPFRASSETYIISGIVPETY
jgi:hypothetical protein